MSRSRVAVQGRSRHTRARACRSAKMPDRHGHTRQRRTPPTIRRPRVPAGQRLVREHGWLTTDHPQAYWYRVIGHSADWSEVRLHVAAVLDADGVEVNVVVRPDG